MWSNVTFSKKADFGTVSNSKIRNQCGFTKAGRGGDEGEFAALLYPLVEFFDEVGAGEG